MDGTGWIVVVVMLVFLAWAIVKRLFRLALLAGVLIIALVAGVYLANQ